MPDADWLVERFESERKRLRAVAYRMLGSMPEARMAVPGSVASAEPVQTPATSTISTAADHGRRAVSLTAAVAQSRREEPVGTRIPDRSLRTPTRPIRAASHPGRLGGPGAAGRARIIVAAERLAFVLHDLFDIPFGGDRADHRRRPLLLAAGESRASESEDRSRPGSRSREARSGWLTPFLAAARERPISTDCSPYSIPTS